LIRYGVKRKKAATIATAFPTPPEGAQVPVVLVEEVEVVVVVVPAGGHCEAGQEVVVMALVGL
jgi:hypothetical protein